MNHEENPKKQTLLRNPEVEPLLSARQWHILDLQAEGKPYKEIAHTLGLSVNTVKNHLSRIRAKLGAANGMEAVHKAYKHG